MLPADDELLSLLADHRNLPPDHLLDLAGDAEPGRRMTILARLLDAGSGEPLPGVRIEVYQADASGSYEESVPGQESSARLRGTVVSNAAGRFTLVTVLPGDYGSTARNRHIHTTVPGADPESYDLYFNQFVNDGLRSWAESSSQAVLVDLRRTNTGILVGSAEIEVQRFVQAVSLAR